MRPEQEDRCYDAVVAALESLPRQAEMLASSEDAQGRPAVNIACTRCKRALLESIYLFRRYEIQTLAQPHHESATCVVHLGLDHGDGGRPVALKFMRIRDAFERELEARREGGFAAEFVAGALRGHDADADPGFAAEVQRKGLGNTPYLVVMEAGARSLADIIVKEHLAGDWDRIRVLSGHVTMKPSCLLPLLTLLIFSPDRLLSSPFDQLSTVSCISYPFLCSLPSLTDCLGLPNAVGSSNMPHARQGLHSRRPQA